MPAPHEKPFIVFYSWQSDLPDGVNLKLIRNALSQAANTINSEDNLSLHAVVDEATREVPGSPNIADTIFEKIRNADVFVCDLTKVAEMTNAAGSVRKYSNSNVALELGYAVRVLGWSRIVIVFNEGYGLVPDDLPFDARGHRTAKYRCKEESDSEGKPTQKCKADIKNAIGQLRAILVEALKLIVKDNPKRPHELEAQPPEAIKRERDIKQLKKVFYWLNLGVLDEFIDRLGYSCLTSIGTEFFDCFSETVQSTHFHFNDPELERLVGAFYRAWEECFRYSHAMDLRSSGLEAHFSMPGDYPRYPKQAEEAAHVASQAGPLRAALDALLSYVRQNYLEIDPRESGRDAVREYLAARKKPAIE